MKFTDSDEIVFDTSILHIISGENAEQWVTPTTFDKFPDNPKKRKLANASEKDRTSYPRVPVIKANHVVEVRDDETTVEHNSVIINPDERPRTAIEQEAWLEWKRRAKTHNANACQKAQSREDYRVCVLVAT